MNAAAGPGVFDWVAAFIMLAVCAWLAWASFRHPGDANAPSPSPGWRHHNGRIK